MFSLNNRHKEARSLPSQKGGLCSFFILYSLKIASRPYEASTSVVTPIIVFIQIGYGVVEVFPTLLSSDFITCTVVSSTACLSLSVRMSFSVSTDT